MKIQCSCGTKYAFDVTPEMLAEPITFVCQQCGADGSAVVNQMIREVFGVQSIAAAPPPVPAPPPAKPPPAIRIAGVHRAEAAPTVQALPAAAGASLRVATPVSAAAAVQGAGGDGPKPCPKHVGQW